MSESNREVMEALKILGDEMIEWSYAVKVGDALGLPEDLDRDVDAALAARGLAVVRSAVERLAPLGLFESDEGLWETHAVVKAMKRLSEFADFGARD